MLFKNLGDLLTRAGADLVAKVQGRVKPLADENTEPHPAMSDLLRAPLAFQRMVVMGLLRLLAKKPFGFLAAQMGMGKTYMATVLAYLYWIDRQGRRDGVCNLVVCPPHLVPTWFEEIAMTLPAEDFRVFRVGRMADGAGETGGIQEMRWDAAAKAPAKVGLPFRLADLRNPQFVREILGNSPDGKPKLCFFVASRETLKLGPSWKTATATRKRWTENYEKERSARTRNLLRFVGNVPTSNGTKATLWRFYPAYRHHTHILVVESEGIARCFASTRHGVLGEKLGEQAGTTDSYLDWLCAPQRFNRRIIRPEAGESRTAFLRRGFTGITEDVPVCPDSGKRIERDSWSSKAGHTYRVPSGGASVIDTGEGKAVRWIGKPAGGCEPDNDRKGYAAWWEYDGRGLRRWPPGEFIIKYLKGFFTLLIVDESHEFNNGESAQGNMLNRLTGVVDKLLVLTGTLTNGKAQALHAPLWRTSPTGMKALGYGLDKGSRGIRAFTDTYGFVETVRKIHPTDNRTTKARQTVRMRTIPGIMPDIHAADFGNGLLLEQSVFLQLDLISSDLPEIGEEVELVSPHPDVMEAYEAIEEDFRRLWVEDRKLANKALGKFVSTLTCYPDRPYGWGPIIVDGTVVTVPRNLDSSIVYPKERAFIELCRRERSRGRKVLAFVNFVNFGTPNRLVELLRLEGVKAEYMASIAVKPENRSKWFADAVRRGVEVVVCNPESVKTGLTLLDFPTICFYQAGFNIVTNVQASKRSYRIGAKRDVRIHYLGYKHTIQADTLIALSRKKNALENLQGIFGEGALAELDDDLSYAVAKMLIANKATERAARPWDLLRGVVSEDDWGDVFDWLESLADQAEAPAVVPPALLDPSLAAAVSQLALF